MEEIKEITESIQSTAPIERNEPEMEENTPPVAPIDNSNDELGPESEAPSTPTAEEIAALIAEAEERGYLRGRNEMIEQMMQEPPLFSNPARHKGYAPTASSASEPDPARDFLAHIRPQVWD